MPDFSVPAYLEPPSQAERERLDMAAQQINDRAFEGMQRRVTLAKMQGDANAAQAAGADVFQARQSALLKYAPELFQDQPEVADKITQQIESKLKREAAIKSYQAYISSQIADGEDPTTAAANGWARFGLEINPAGFSPFVARNLSTSTTADSRQAALDQAAKIHAEKMDLEKTKEEDRNQRAAAAEEGRNQRAAARLGVGANAPEPVIKEVDGVKYLYVPGSKQLHLIKDDSSLKSFLMHNIPALLRQGYTEDESEKMLTQAWTKADATGKKPASTNDVQDIGGFKVRVKK